MDPLEVTFVAVGVAAGATLQSAVGFGFALLSGPAAFAVAEPAEAITILIVLGALLNVLVVAAERRPSEVRRGDVGHLLAWAAPGVLAGVFILVALSKPALQVIVGICVVGAVALQARSARPEPGASHSLARAAAGLAAGTLTTTTATSGPPLVLYLQRAGARPEAFRDTIAALFLGLNLMGVVALVLAGDHAELPELAVLAILVVAVVIGRAAGRFLFDRLDHDTFRAAGLALIVISGIASVVAGVIALA